MGVPRSRLTRQSFRPGGAGKRLTEWASLTNTAPAVIAASTFSLLGSFTAVELGTVVPATLVRIRGQILLQSDQNITYEEVVGSLGIAVVKEEARAAGAASLPDPFASAGNDFWLYWVSLMWAGLQSDGAVTTIPLSIEVDAKAMRKFADGDAIVVMVANHHGANGLKIGFQGRFLFLLH